MEMILSLAFGVCVALVVNHARRTHREDEP